MASFRPLGQFVQYFLADGSVNAGGSITFYQTDLTTLKNTYSDPGLTVLNANPVVLDADGRLSTDVWGSGVYGAVLKDALGTTLETLNNIQSGADPGFTIPSLVTGDFLTNDGSNLLWQPIVQVPDPTGSGGDLLSTDGTLVFWKTVASLGIPTISIVGNSANLGGLLIQRGTDTLPASGGNTTSKAITFPTAYTGGTPWVGITNNSGSGATSAGKMVILGAQSVSGTGFTCVGDVNNNSGNPPITASTAISWIAIGNA